jgi:hypothetical protein
MNEYVEYRIPLDVALPDFLLKIEQNNGDRPRDISFEDLEIDEQSEFMSKSDDLIRMLKPYLKINENHA